MNVKWCFLENNPSFSFVWAPFDTQTFWPLFASHQAMPSSRGMERTCLRPHSHLVAKPSLKPQQPWAHFLHTDSIYCWLSGKQLHFLEPGF